MFKKKIFIPIILSLLITSCGGGDRPSSDTVYTITFSTNGGSSVPEQNIKRGEKASKPSDPNKNGYTFIDWYEDESLNIAYDFSNVVTSTFTLYAKWNVNKYKVSFDSNEGSQVSPQNVSFGKRAIKPNNPTKEGYTFVSWCKDSELTKVYNFDNFVINDITLYAKWEPIIYYITYDLNYGENDPRNPTFYTIEDSFTLKSPYKKGYTFLNWTKDGTVISNIEKGTTGDLKINANYNINQYEINFESNGGTLIPMQKVCYGDELTEPEEPIKPGYKTFGGWYLDEEFKELYDFSLPVKNNFTLYAKWEDIIFYTISYQLNGGENNPENPETYTVESEFIFKEPTRTGYNFSMWTKGPNKIEEIKKGTTGDISLSANWNILKFTIKFETNGGSAVEDQEVDYGAKIIIPKDPKKDGYSKFDGWFLDEELKEAYDFSTPVTSDFTLYASYSNLINYKINYDLKGGENHLRNPFTYTILDHVIFENPFKLGSDFMMWTSNGKQISEIKPGTFGDIEITANWNVHKFSITFDTKGGSQIPSTILNYGDKLARPESPTKNGYNFIDWYKDSECTILYDFNKPITKSFTIYSKWSDPINYSITYNLNGGENDTRNPLTYTVEDSFSLYAPTKIENAFVNWTINDSPVSFIEQGTTGDLLINANWIINRYNINVYSNDETKGVVSGGGEYDFGTKIKVTATPKENCYFVGWFLDESHNNFVTNEKEYEFTVPSGGKTLYAEFITEQEKWDRDHGVIPVISNNKKTLTYGLYPQEYINSPSEELIKAGEGKANEEYFEFENEYYVKDIANPYNDDGRNYYTFGDGIPIIKDNVYYFKCQPITWNIILNEDGIYTIDCANILYSSCYSNSSTFYGESDLRNWLTPIKDKEESGTFYNQAFFINSSYIVPIDISDVGAIEDEKVWVGSKEEYLSNWEIYDFDESREKSPTDFALCNYALLHSESEPKKRTGCYFTRTAEVSNINIINYDGTSTYSDISIKYMGIVPAIKIKINIDEVLQTEK